MTQGRTTCAKWLESHDAWGKPVTLRFNNKRTMPTIAGGVTTFTYRLILGIYLLNIVFRYVEHGGGTEIQQSSVLKSHFGTEFYDLSAEKFMTGFKLTLMEERTNDLFGRLSLKESDPHIVHDFYKNPKRYVQGWFLEKSLENGQIVHNYIESDDCESKIDNLEKNKDNFEDWKELKTLLGGFQCPVKKGELPLGIS
jgi:hypothetical protein